jgi:hypothetical protein
VRPDDPAALAGVLGLALGHRHDRALKERLHEAAQALRWSLERQRLLTLYERLAGEPSARRVDRAALPAGTLAPLPGGDKTARA